MSDKLILSQQQAKELLKIYGTPLYIYDETILRNRCKELKNFIKSERFVPNYSAKANTNIELLKIIREEGFTVDAMSPGEIVLELKAGFTSDEILFISNNVTPDEMDFAVKHNILISFDSLVQLEEFGKKYNGHRAVVRINPGIGAGHSDKVITGGKSKFGIQVEKIQNIKEIEDKYNLKIVGLNQHIGSCFLNGTQYENACSILLDAAAYFPELKFVDFGGGFGIPYQGEERLDLSDLSEKVTKLIHSFEEKYPDRKLVYKVEPGRYLTAECGQLLGTVTSIKENYGEKYVGTDIGFHVFMRPVLYDSYHEIVVYNDEVEKETVTVVGNICESGDIIAVGRHLNKMKVADCIGIKDVGAYGYSMASNYNARLRPAEVLLGEGDSHRLIRRRETLDDLLNQI